MAIPLDPKQVVSFEELLMSQVVQQEALTRLLVSEGSISEDELLEIVKTAYLKMNKVDNGKYSNTRTDFKIYFFW
jgi:hypothetical protein